MAGVCRKVSNGKPDLEPYSRFNEKKLNVFARKLVMKDVKRIQPFCSPRNYALVVDWLLTGQDERATEECQMQQVSTQLRIYPAYTTVPLGRQT